MINEIDKLIGIEGEENTTQETRFANYLRQLFPADVRTMTVAARALGKTAGLLGWSCHRNHSLSVIYSCCAPNHYIVV